MAVQLIAETCNHQIMNDIQAKATIRHVSGELSSVIEFCLKPPHHREAGQPSVETSKPVAKILWRGVILSESGDNQCDT